MRLPKDQHWTANIHTTVELRLLRVSSSRTQTTEMRRQSAARSVAGYRPKVGDWVMVHSYNRTPNRRWREGSAVGSTCWAGDAQCDESCGRNAKKVERHWGRCFLTCVRIFNDVEDEEKTGILHTKTQVLLNRMQMAEAMDTEDATSTQAPSKLAAPLSSETAASAAVSDAETVSTCIRQVTRCVHFSQP